MSFAAHVIAKTEYVFEMSEQTTVARFLERCECESMILLFNRSVPDALETFRYVIERSPSYRALERPYMDRLSVHDGIVSFAMNHYGVFVIGTPTYVLERCFRPLLTLLEVAYET